MYNKLFSKSDFIISKFNIVLNLSPICPAIFFPLKTFPGSCLCPVDPWDLCETETPCDALNPPKFHLFITPAKPLPIVFDLTSINFLSFNISNPSSFPSLYSSILSILNSFKIFFGSVFFFVKYPFICFVNFEFFILKKPTLTALYPLLSLEITSRTLPFSTLITVTGTDCPVSINSLVIPILVPINPMLILNLYFYIHTWS